jgi:hypothetical protein
MFSACCQSILLTAFVLNCPEMLSSKRRYWDGFDRIMKHWDCVPGKVMHLECWNCMTISFSMFPTGNKKITTKLNLQCNVCLCLCILWWNCQHSGAQQQLFLITTDSTCYSSVLLLWSQIVPGLLFSGKCLVHRTVPVECLGESYCWLMLVGNINCYVCDCAQ